MRRPTSLTLATALLLSAAATAGGETAAGAAGDDVFPYPVHEKTLANGLHVVAIPFASPGVVAYFTVVRTGSRDEVEPGHSGFAHFFEHMMFRGTERYSADAYNEVLKRMGADSNAFTTDDYTCYFLIGPSAELAAMADIESDRFKNLKYGEEAFKTEALAVLGEYNKGVSNPLQPMFEKIRDLAYSRHTYEHTTIGLLDDIKAMPGYYDYSLGFFDRFYRPENVVLLVVGDAAPEAVFALAERKYGDWKPGYRAPDVAAEPPQPEGREARIDWATPTPPYLMVGYHLPAFSTATVDTAALDLVDQLLTSESAPLYRELVIDRQWVDRFGAFGGYQRDPGLYIFFARVKSPELVPEVRGAIAEAVAGLGAEPVDAERLARIKSHLRYDFARGLDSPAGIAFRAAEFLSLTGDVGAINAHYRRIAEVTPADVQRLAREVFRATNRTEVVLSHLDQAEGGKPAAGEGGPAAAGGATGGEGRGR